MRVTAIDEQTWTKKSLDVPDWRVAMFDHYLTTHPDILGMGAGSPFGRAAAKDAVEAQAHLVSQLAYTEAKMYAVRYQPRMAEQLVGEVMTSKAGPGAETVEYQVIDHSGLGRRISSMSNRIPQADVAWFRKSLNVVTGGIGYNYSLQDLRRAAFMQRPLEEEKVKAALNGYRDHMNIVALQGEAQSGFTGLFNNAFVTTANRASGAVWSGASPDTIISDFQVAMTAISVQTKNTAQVTDVVMPIATNGLLVKPRSTTTDTSVMTFLKNAYPGVRFWMADELATLGAGATKRVVFFAKEDDNMVWHVPMPISFIAPQPKELQVFVNGEYRYGGFEVRRPLTMYYMDGV